MNYSIEKITGIDCIFAPMEGANSTSIMVICKSGKNNETKEENGLSHCLEHMLFKGGEIYPTEYKLFEAIDSIGAQRNGSTSLYTNLYFINSAPEFTLKSIEILSDIIVNPKLDKEDFEREKGVIIQEIKKDEDNPQKYAYNSSAFRYIGDNSFGRPTCGTEKYVRNFTTTDLKKYKNDLYTKDNIVIVIAGKNANNEKIKEQINKNFSGLNKKRTRPTPKYQENRPINHILYKDKGLKQNQLIMTTKGFNDNENKKYTAEILGTILGGGRTSLLMSTIREKESLCYNINGHHRTTPDFGYFMISSGLDKDKFEYGLEKINEILLNLSKGNITQEMLDIAIGFNIGRIHLSKQTPYDIAYFLGNQYLLTGKIETVDDIVKKYKNTTLNDVKQICNMIKPENWYTFCVK